MRLWRLRLWWLLLQWLRLRSIWHCWLRLLWLRLQTWYTQQHRQIFKNDISCNKTVFRLLKINQILSFLLFIFAIIWFRFALLFSLRLKAFHFKRFASSEKTFFCCVSSKRKSVCFIFASFRFNLKRTAHPNSNYYTVEVGKYTVNGMLAII
jgi:hypothetical protein